MIRNPIPVFMYHSIGIPNPSWRWNFLTIHYQAFENQLKFFRRNNYKSIFLNELHDHINGKINLDKNSVVLTFDDGYADNYIFAYPLLKKYGFKGTIFINPEFVDPRPLKRKRLDQTKDISELEDKGYLSWDEMKEMENDGVIDIQSHALTHTWYPISSKIIDFRHPDDNYLWMTWNSNILEKPFLQLDNPDLIQFGQPVYENEKSLLAKRYFPDHNLSNYLIKYVKTYGGESFFKRNNWRNDLFQQCEVYKSKYQINDRFETESEKVLRLKIELLESKRAIELNLNKEVEFLCWPGGSGSREGNELAIEVGYKMTTAARDIPKSIRSTIKNDGESFPNRISRISPILYQYKSKNNLNVIVCNSIGLKLRIAAFKAEKFNRKLLIVITLLYGFVKSIFNNKN